MFQLKKVKMRKMGKRKPPYESNQCIDSIAQTDGGVM